MVQNFNISVHKTEEKTIVPFFGGYIYRAHIWLGIKNDIASSFKLGV